MSSQPTQHDRSQAPQAEGGREAASRPPMLKSPPYDAVSQLLCHRVRELRTSRGWTLEELSAACGVSRSMLSQIERNQANPTLAVAYRIAQAFGMSLGDLVEAPGSTTRIDVIRREDRSYQFRSDEHCRIRTLSPLHLEKDVEFYEVALAVGGALRSAPHFEGTREFLTVQKGSVQLICGDETTELAMGDSAHYPADVTHAIENTSCGESLIFLVVTYRNG